MKKYFINNGNTQLGPFDIEELKAKKINKETIVWHEGLAAWTAARNIDELKPLFYVIPPSYSTQINSSAISDNKSQNNNTYNFLITPSYFGISKRTFAAITIVLLLIITTFLIIL